MIRSIVLGFGFAESQSIGVVIFTAQSEFASAKEAIYSLSSWLYEKWGPNFLNEEPNSCCSGTLAYDSKAKYCSRCGSRMNKTFFVDGWTQYLTGLLSKNLNDFGYDDVDNPDDWEPELMFAISNNEVLVIGENAAEMITYAIFDQRPELIKIADKAPCMEPDYYLYKEYCELIEKK